MSMRKPLAEGTRLRYTGEAALGESHMGAADRKSRAQRRATIGGGGDLSRTERIMAEIDSSMEELDLHPGTEVEVVGFEDERDLVIVSWTDRQGNPRRTTVSPDELDAQFERR
jgi:hypothetical protein